MTGKKEKRSAAERKEEDRRGRDQAVKKPAREKHTEDKLDEALRETFPASDPIDVSPGKEPSSDEGEPERGDKPGAPARRSGKQ